MRIGSSISARGPVKQPRPQLGSGVQAEKTEVVDTMIDRGFSQTLRGVSPNQEELLKASLGRVDRGVLRWADDQGVRLQVLQTGEELEATDALRDLSGRFEQRINAETVDKIHQHLASLTDRIRAEKDPEKASSLRYQKRVQLAKILTDNPSGAAVFTPAFAPLLAPGLSSLKADPTETPTLKSMALHHGADTLEEQEKFYSWMEALNGERLDEARQASIEERSRLLASRPEAQQRWLKQAKTNPETVPLDTTLYTVVVPDAHFLPATSGDESLLLDRSDLRSVEGWREGNFRGQWFFLDGKTNLLVRDTAVELDTPVHELGHVIDMTLEKQEPEFYGTLRKRIEKGHYQARLNGNKISNYAMANTREYIAEGFTAYYSKPEELREVDPTLYQIVDEMVEFCCQKTGADRVLDTKLQKMWKDSLAADASQYQPTALREEFQKRLKATPTADSLTKNAMSMALAATQLGLLTGAAEVALGLKSVTAPPTDAVVESIQDAYLNGIDAQEQTALFELGYEHGRALSSGN